MAVSQVTPLQSLSSLKECAVPGHVQGAERPKLHTLQPQIVGLMQCSTAGGQSARMTVQIPMEDRLKGSMAWNKTSLHMKLWARHGFQQISPHSSSYIDF